MRRISVSAHSRSSSAACGGGLWALDRQADVFFDMQHKGTFAGTLRRCIARGSIRRGPSMPTKKLPIRMAFLCCALHGHCHRRHAERGIPAVQGLRRGRALAGHQVQGRRRPADRPSRQGRQLRSAPHPQRDGDALGRGGESHADVRRDRNGQGVALCRCRHGRWPGRAVQHAEGHQPVLDGQNAGAISYVFTGVCVALQRK
jgi:hypothetical protein